MNTTITSGLINYPILYFNHYHQQEIVDQIISAAKHLYPEMYSEEDVVNNNVDDEDLEENTLIKVIDYSAFRVNRNAIWANSPSLEEQDKTDLKWMYTKELRNIVANMSKENLPERPCIYIFRSVPYDLLSNDEFVSYLYKYLAFHERWQRKQKDTNISWTIALIVPSGEFPPPSVEGVVRLMPITPPEKDEIMLEIDSVFTKQETEEKEEFCKSLQGLQLFDIRQIIRSTRTVIGDKLSYRSIQWAREEKQQIIRKTGILEVVTPNVSFEDIGGLTILKNDLESKATIYKHLGILQNRRIGCQIPKGVLLIGMPGCGKTMIAKAVASKFELPLLRLDIGKLLGQYVGQSEANLRRALDVVESAHPCVLWIDEIEKAFAGTSNTSGDNNDLMMRLMGTFLTWMQERDNQKNPVFIVATANDVMKPEFMRKGRFDDVYFVDFPNKEERISISRAIASEFAKVKDSIIKFDLSDEEWSALADDMCINNIQRASKKELGLSGAEIKSLINMVVEAKCIERIQHLENEKKISQFWENEFIGNGEIEIKRADFDIFLKEFKQSAMILQSKWLFREAEADKKNHINKLDVEVDEMDERNNFIDRIYAKQMQYHFKSATK